MRMYLGLHGLVCLYIYAVYVLISQLKLRIVHHLLNIAGIRTLEERRKFQALVLVYKCFHNEPPRYIEDFFKIKICNYNLRGSGTLLTLPSFNLEWRHKSFLFLAANFGTRYQRVLETPKIFLLLNVF